MRVAKSPGSVLSGCYSSAQGCMCGAQLRSPRAELSTAKIGKRALCQASTACMLSFGWLAGPGTEQSGMLDMESLWGSALAADLPGMHTKFGPLVSTPLGCRHPELRGGKCCSSLLSHSEPV